MKEILQSDSYVAFVGHGGSEKFFTESALFASARRQPSVASRKQHVSDITPMKSSEKYHQCNVGLLRMENTKLNFLYAGIYRFHRRSEMQPARRRHGGLVLKAVEGAESVPEIVWDTRRELKKRRPV